MLVYIELVQMTIMDNSFEQKAPSKESLGRWHPPSQGVYRLHIDGSVVQGGQWALMTLKVTIPLKLVNFWE